METDGLRIDDKSRVLCPVWSINGELISIQTISETGIKLFFKNTSTKSGPHVFGSIETSDELYFCEGVVTGLL